MWASDRYRYPVAFNPGKPPPGYPPPCALPEQDFVGHPSIKLLSRKNAQVARAAGQAHLIKAAQAITATNGQPQRFEDIRSQQIYCSFKKYRFRTRTIDADSSHLLESES